MKKGMTEKQIEKFVKYALECNYITISFKEKYNYKDKDKIVALSTEPVSEETVNKLMEEKDYMKLIAIMSNPKNPVKYTEDIVLMAIEQGNYFPYRDFSEMLRKYIILKSLERDLSEKTLNEMMKKQFSIVSDALGKYEDKTWGNDFTYKEISEHNLETMVKLFMRRKSYRRNAAIQPVRYIKNEEIARECLDHPKCDEVTRTAIAKNKNLSDKIRDEAFDGGVDYKEFYVDLTPHMINEVYESVVSAYTDGLVNPANYGKINGHSPAEIKADKKPHENARYFLKQMIENGAVTESVEIDLFNRIADYQSNYTNPLLIALLINTKSEYIFNHLNSIKHKYDVVFGYDNPNIPKDIVDKKTEEYVKKFGNKSQMPQYAEFYFDRIGRKYELPDSIYQYFLNKYKNEPSEILHRVEYGFIPNRYLNEIMENRKDVLVKVRNSVDIDVVIYNICAVADIFRKHLSVQEATNMLSYMDSSGMISRIKRTQKNDEFIIEDLSGNNYYFKELLERYKKIDTEKIENIKKDFKDRIEKTKDPYLKTLYNSMINNLDILEEAKNTDMVEGFLNNKNLFFIQEYFLNTKENGALIQKVSNVTSKFCDEVMENPVNMYLKCEQYAEEAIEFMEKVDKTKPAANYYEERLINYLKEFDEMEKEEDFDR